MLHNIAWFNSWFGKSVRLVLLVVACALTACGQKGSLYLPDKTNQSISSEHGDSPNKEQSDQKLKV
ncbi:hypothetical protein MOMA_07641 [Moraxella macacae 0408225]|uniref:Lipoprotein n=1 Tax=Moraxella macacae 0408225 TaxID=1230338 RepID=L2F6J3_9GAMM|nr:lipoprotein [Moraxella macacae]ELA08416.1 hypothetical protein MOMA_07641 [Moraxella macacae 0408225]